ncbi:MAG: response regulator [Candidatus Omnitrophota bacterium]
MDAKKILIVDDETQLVDLMAARLQMHNYEVSVAYDGEGALKSVHGDPPDLIILDLKLPKIDGYMVCSLLKNDTKYKSIPIILFTARDKEEDIELGKKVGADAYLTKPCDLQTLLDEMLTLLK